MAKTAQLKAALELGKRLSMQQPDKRFQIKSADDAANVVRMQLMFLGHEEMHILILDTKNQLVELIKRYKGTVNSSVLRSAEIFRPAIVRNCPNVIICPDSNHKTAVYRAGRVLNALVFQTLAAAKQLLLCLIPSEFPFYLQR